jgi:hypothetical protein
MEEQREQTPEDVLLYERHTAVADTFFKNRKVSSFVLNNQI